MDFTGLAFMGLVASLVFGALWFARCRFRWPFRRTYKSFGVNLIMSGDPERFWRHRSRAVGLRPSQALRLAERGQALWEYAIVVACIALGLYSVALLFAHRVQEWFAPIRAMFQT